MSKPDRNVTTCVHEAAHIIAALERGVVPESVATGTRGGCVELPPAMSAETSAIIAAAGQVAVQTILCDDSSDWSEEDSALLSSAAMKLDTDVHRFGKWAFNAAAQLLGPLEAEVVAMADYLMQHPGKLDQGALRAACAPTTPLAKYRRMFPVPKPKPATRAHGRSSMRTPSRGILASRRGNEQWSADVRRMVLDECGLDLWAE